MFTITTPAILFPAISLILLAYTAKFIHLGSLVRKLKEQYLREGQPEILEQILNLRKRIYLIRNMQISGSLSFFFSVVCMFFVLGNEMMPATYTFAISLFFLLISLFLSFREIMISANALEVLLKDFRRSSDKEK